jgi:hypothetical protein
LFFFLLLTLALHLALFPKQISDGFNLEVQRGMGPRFMTIHKMAIGQRNQEDPPSSYSLMTHLATESGALLVGLWSTHGNMMARFINEGKGSLFQAAYNAHVNAKGEESTSTEFDYSVAASRTSRNAKYAYQNTPQGGAGVFEVSYVEQMMEGLYAGVHGLYIPSQSRFMPSLGLRYERSFSNEAQETDWNANVTRALAQVEKLTEEDQLSAYDSCVLAAAFFKPKWIASANVSPFQGVFDFAYVRKLSSSITLGTQFTLSPPPPSQNNPQPSLKAKWLLGYEYVVEPDQTSAKVGLTNFDAITCAFDDSVTDFLSVNVSAQANWAKDQYKAGFGITLKL